MSTTETQAIVQASTGESRSVTADVPEWKELLDDVEAAADLLSSAVDDLTAALDRIEWDGDAPEDVRDAAEDASTEAYTASADVEHRLRALRAAVARVGADEATGEEGGQS
jgi:hypothetical protein